SLTSRFLSVFFFLLIPPPPRSTLFPYRRSSDLSFQLTMPLPITTSVCRVSAVLALTRAPSRLLLLDPLGGILIRERVKVSGSERSEEHTSELQSLTNLVCRLLLEKKNTYIQL